MRDTRETDTRPELAGRTKWRGPDCRTGDTTVFSRVLYQLSYLAIARAMYPHEKRRPGPVLPRRERPCAAEPYDRRACAARSADAGPAEKSATCEKPRRSSSAPHAVERHPDRRRGAHAVGDRDVAAGRGDARELVEERDHVVQRHEVERAVGVRQRATRRRRRSARARSSRAAAPRSIIPRRDVDARHLARRASARRRARATAPRAGAEVEHARRRGSTRVERGARSASELARATRGRVPLGREPVEVPRQRPPEEPPERRRRARRRRHEPREALARRSSRRAIRSSSPARRRSAGRRCRG